MFVWYNNYGKREREQNLSTHQIHKQEVKTMMNRAEEIRKRLEAIADEEFMLEMCDAANCWARNRQRMWELAAEKIQLRNELKELEGK